MILGDFELFCERNQSGMYHVALKILRDSLDAEDAVQSTFEKIFRLVDKIEFETERAEQVYARRAVRTVSIDMLRQRKQLELIAAFSRFPSDDIPLNSVCAEESAHEILKILGPKASTIFSLRRIGLADAEIAKELGVSISDVRTTVYRARTRIAHVLERKEGGHAE